MRILFSALEISCSKAALIPVIHKDLPICSGLKRKKISSGKRRKPVLIISGMAPNQPADWEGKD